MDNYDLKDDGFGGEGVLTVLEYQGKKGQSTISKRPCNNLYVKNFSTDPSFTDDSLAELFSEFG